MEENGCSDDPLGLPFSTKEFDNFWVCCQNLLGTVTMWFFIVNVIIVGTTFTRWPWASGGA